VRRRNVVATVLECRPHTVAAFAYRSVRETYGVKVLFTRFNGRNINLNFNDVGIDPIDGGA
jgi:hypothetical protein